jgi:hypothetical protein
MSEVKQTPVIIGVTSAWLLAIAFILGFLHHNFIYNYFPIMNISVVLIFFGVGSIAAAVVSDSLRNMFSRFFSGLAFSGYWCLWIGLALFFINHAMLGVYTLMLGYGLIIGALGVGAAILASFLNAD